MRDILARLSGLLKGRRVTLVGLGVSHTELAGCLARLGIDLTVCDRRGPDQLGSVCGELGKLGVRLLLGSDYPESFDTDVLLRTPGMYFHAPALDELRRAGGIVTSEMELFCDLCPCPVIAVTGSDGKTTTSTLIAEMLRAQGHTVHLGGNIGKALLPVIDRISPEDFAVVELSSFQLISMRQSPAVSVITNITPDHLDVHKNMEEYVGAKRNVFIHQNAFSVTVLNEDDDTVRTFAPEARGRVRMFSLEHPVRDGAFLDDGILYSASHGQCTPLLRRDEIRLLGIHNVANILAAACAVRDHVESAPIRRVAESFAGVEHRIEFVRELDGVKWYNDSIATSPVSVMVGLASFERPVILIAGGSDKKLSYSPLAPVIAERVRLLILTGATADKIESALTGYEGYIPGKPVILRAANMADAVKLAREHAISGDIVTLSPASASFDSYQNFEARGRHFKDLVNAL